MRSMNHVMPLSRRIFFPLTIPIPARHAMCPFSRHPTTIIHPTPSRPVRGDILPPPKIILLGSTPCPGQSRFLTRIPIPPRPIGLQVGTGGLGGFVANDSNVYIRSLVGDDVKKAPPAWPVVLVSGARVFGPDPADRLVLSGHDAWRILII